MAQFNTVIYSANQKQDGLTHEEVWDDSLLIRHYEEVKAKMERKMGRDRSTTGTSVADSDTSMRQESEGIQEVDSSVKRKNKKKGKKRDWSVNEYCRFKYSGDGNIYEAQIEEMNKNTGTCRIKYLGYGNEEVVTITRLMRTLGEMSRKRQCQEAEECGYGSNSEMKSGVSYITVDSEMTSDAESIASKRKRNPSTPMSAMPKLPHLPDLPPPPAIGLNVNEPNSEALHTMLMSWYMTGYHTGYYQGLQASRKHSGRK